MSIRKKRFENKREFFDALSRVDNDAVKLLAQEITYTIRQATLKARLSLEDAEELINDAVVITISNIREGKVQFMDYSPVAYATGVGRKLVANRIRSSKPSTENLDDIQLPSDFDADLYLKNKDLEKLIGQFLSKLGDNCRALIQFKFFSQLRDAEVIEQKLTPYNSVDTLKSKRSQCMKKLSELVQQAGGRELMIAY